MNLYSNVIHPTNEALSDIQGNANYSQPKFRNLHFWKVFAIISSIKKSRERTFVLNHSHTSYISHDSYTFQKTNSKVSIEQTTKKPVLSKSLYTIDTLWIFWYTRSISIDLDIEMKRSQFKKKKLICRLLISPTNQNPYNYRRNLCSKLLLLCFIFYF